MPKKPKDQSTLVTTVEIDDWRGREKRKAAKVIYTAFFISIGCMAYALAVMNTTVLMSSTFVMCASVLAAGIYEQ